MNDEIIRAKETIQRYRSMVNAVWEAWLSNVPKRDPDFTRVNDAFDNALDKIADTYEKLIDLMSNAQLPETDRAQLATTSILEGAATETATALQRVASWYLSRISQQSDRWIIRVFLPTEDIYEGHKGLQKDFDAAVKKHELNQFHDAANQYDGIITRAIDLLTKTKTRSSRHPQRRLFFLSVAISFLLFLIAISVTLYLNLRK